MNRRDAIKKTSFLLGGSLSASAIFGVMSGCKAEPTLDWTPSFFNANEGQLIENLVECILPRTDSVGALDAGVHVFIDKMLADFYQENEKTAFRNGLKKIDEGAKKDFGKKFTSLTDEQQEELLKKYDEATYSQTTGEKHFFKKIKELTILGFCTSEIGASEFLKYEVLPGDYKGCIPYSDIGRAWATT